MIIVNLDVIMAKRKISSNELAEKIGITPVNLSILKTNKGKAISFHISRTVFFAATGRQSNDNKTKPM